MQHTGNCKVRTSNPKWYDCIQADTEQITNLFTDYRYNLLGSYEQGNYITYLKSSSISRPFLSTIDLGIYHSKF